MGKSVLTILLAGLCLAAAGCENGAIPFEIRYQKPSAPSANEGTRTEGETGDVIVPSGPSVGGSAGDEVITPEEYAGTPAPEAPAPEAPAPVAPAPEAPAPETPAVADGDGVVDTEPDIGTPPLPPAVSCDEPAFAFVSKRERHSNVFTFKQGSLSRVTANDSGFVSYSNLVVHPRTHAFAADQHVLLLLIPLIRTVFGSTVEAVLETSLPSEGSLTRGFAWNREGTKAAYLRMTPERRHISTAIHYVTNLGTMETQRDMVVDPLGHYFVGKMSWLNNKVVYDVTVDGRTTIGITDPERVPAYFQAVYAESPSELTYESPHLEGKQPAAGKDGTLAFVETGADGREILVACRLQEDIRAYSTWHECVGRRILASAGNNHSPSWSPDGRWIYFVSDRDGNKEIYRIRPDGTGEENLTNNPADDTSPAPFAPYTSCE